VIAIVMAGAALFNKDVRQLERVNELVNVD
jgi:hypothetical protein